MQECSIKQDCPVCGQPLVKGKLQSNTPVGFPIIHHDDEIENPANSELEGDYYHCNNPDHYN